MQSLIKLYTFSKNLNQFLSEFIHKLFLIVIFTTIFVINKIYKEFMRELQRILVQFYFRFKSVLNEF